MNEALSSLTNGGLSSVQLRMSELSLGPILNWRRLGSSMVCETVSEDWNNVDEERLNYARKNAAQLNSHRHNITDN
jgi:hypothetical protein